MVVKRVRTGRERYEHGDIQAVRTTLLDERGAFAADLIARWGMIAAVQDGESSNGRQKTRNMTPHEIVNHALAVAEIFFDEAGKHGMITEITPAELAAIEPASKDKPKEA